MVKHIKTLYPYSSKKRYSKLIYYLSKPQNPNQNHNQNHNQDSILIQETIKLHNETYEKNKTLENSLIKDIEMSIYISPDLNYLQYTGSWPPDFFPDY